MSIIGTVTEVDESQRTCVLEPLNGDAIVYDVRLQAAIGEDNGPVMIPKVGSYGIAVFLGDNNAFLALFQEVDKVIWKVEGQSLEFSKEGFSLSSSEAKYAEQIEKMIDTVTALIGTLLQFQLATNMGPTIKVMPQVVTLLNQHKADFASVKTKLKTILY